MVVVLEGNDKAGKTTIAEALVRKDGFRRVHSGPPTTGDFGREFTLKLADALMAEIQSDNPADLVFDRAHLGELVYGPLDRGAAAMTWGQMARIERILGSAGAVLVWVDTPAYVCWGRAVGTEDAAPLARFEAVHAGYDRAYASSSMAKIRLTDVESIRVVAGWFRQ